MKTPVPKIDPEVQQAVNRLTARQRKLWRHRGHPNSLREIARIIEICPMTDGLRKERR